MGRKKKTSGAEGFLNVVSMLPWQVGVVLSIAAFIGLHTYAGTPAAQAVAGDIKGAGGVAVSALFHALAGILQYILPGIFLLAALMSFVKCRRQSELHDQVANDPAADALEKMTWREFEGLVAEAFRRQGYEVTLRGGDGPDGGVDVELRQGKDKYLVQCKQWKVNKVGVATVRELYGVMTAEKAVGGFVVTSGSFTEEAKQFAEGRSVKLVDARKLRSIVGSTKSAPQRAVPVPVPPQAEPAPSKEDVAPACPKCGGEMVKRTAKKGANAGGEFWGCSSYPACKGVRA